MKIIIIIIIIIVFVLIIKLKSEKFGATDYINPNLFKDPSTNSIPSSITGTTGTGTKYTTSLTATPADNSSPFVNNCSLNGCNKTISCFGLNYDLTLNYNTITDYNLNLTTNQDSTLVNFYLTNDVYANAFMNNTYQLIPIPQVPQFPAAYLATGTNVPTDGSGLAQTVTYNGNIYQIISYNNAIKLSTSYTHRKIVIIGVLNALINLYYSPITVSANREYTGLINDLQTNYIIYNASVGELSNPPGNASTVNITFSPTAKHAVWLYLMARANWIDNQLKNYLTL